jgi:hypothetical protein
MAPLVDTGVSINRHRVAVWVAVHRRSAPFSRIRAPWLTCGANAHEPR